MKKYIFLIIIIPIFFLCNLIFNNDICYAETQNQEQAEDILDENIQNNLDSIDFDNLNDIFKDIQDDFSALLGEDVISTAKEIIYGEYKGSFLDFLNILFKGITKSISDTIPLVISIIAIAILYSMLEGFTSGFVQKPTKQLIYFATYSTIILLVMVEVGSIIKLTTDTINNVQFLMQAVFPILLTMITLLGGVTTTAVFKPMMSIAIMFISTFLSKIIMPLFIASIAFSIVGNLTSSIKLDKLTSFFKSTATYLLGGVFGLFSGFLTFQGLTGGVIDSISIKTAKFAMQSYIPILGGYLSDGFDLMLASIVLIKNSVGAIGMLMLLSIIALPLLKIIILSLGLKLSAAIIEPICNNKLSKMLMNISSNLTLLIISLIGIGFVFLLTIMLVLYTCNGGVL